MKKSKKTIIELCNGDCSPFDDVADEEQKKLISILAEYYERLCLKLDDEGRDILEKYSFCHGELAILESEESLSKGFTLGLKVATEAYKE